MILDFRIQIMRLLTLSAHKFNNWRNMPIIETSLDQLKIVPSEICYPFYYKKGIPGSLPLIYNRKTVVEKFLKAREQIMKKTNLCLIAYDGYRPLAVQEHLFYLYMKKFTVLKFKKIRKKFDLSCSLEDFIEAFSMLKNEERDLLIKANKQYVSFPSKGTCPSPHATGGAIDVWLYDKSGEPVELGCKFDYMDSRAGAFYHKKLIRNRFINERRVIKHRELILGAMFNVGFAIYGPEFWHFSYGDQMWAIVYRKKFAKYGYVELT